MSTQVRQGLFSCAEFWTRRNLSLIVTLSSEGGDLFSMEQQLHMCAVALCSSTMWQCIRITPGHTQHMTASWHTRGPLHCIESVTLATDVSISHRDYSELAVCLCVYKCRKDRTKRRKKDSTNP